MFDKDRHKTILVKILKEIYADPDLRRILGFKGGTAAFLFYDLPRISVDLDFDLLDKTKTAVILKKMKPILNLFGEVLESVEKRYTLFFLLSYQKGERKVKIEVSKREAVSRFEVKNYLGIPVLLMRKEDMAAGKLSAFLTRKRFAARDLFDLWFYLKEGWTINEEVLKEKTGLGTAVALTKAAIKVKTIKQRQLLQGVGELLDEKQKIWAKEKLKDELLFHLKLYLETMHGR